MCVELGYSLEMYKPVIRKFSKILEQQILGILEKTRYKLNIIKFKIYRSRFLDFSKCQIFRDSGLKKHDNIPRTVVGKFRNPSLDVRDSDSCYVIARISCAHFHQLNMYALYGGQNRRRLLVSTNQRTICSQAHGQWWWWWWWCWQQSRT